MVELLEGGEQDVVTFGKSFFCAGIGFGTLDL